MEEKNNRNQSLQRVRKVRIRKGEVIEKAAEFENSAFSLLYGKAKKIILDIVQDQEESSGGGHLISFMGERGSGKTTAMLSFLRSLKEGSIYEKESLEKQKKARFITFDVIDASMLEDEEDLFEIILAQMLVSFLDSWEEKGFMGDSWRGERSDDRKEIQKKFNDLLESFRSLKGNGREEELSSLVSLKNLSFSSRLRQNFQELVHAYLSFEQGTGLSCHDSDYRTYLVFAIDDLDMNIAKGFEMLGQIHRYMLVRGVIIMVTAKYEQLEILGRKYFSTMVERLDRPTDEWKIEYLNKTVKEYLEKMLPSYYRLYLPDFEDRAMGYADNLIVEKEEKIVRDAVIGKIFRRTGIYFDGSGERQHYLMPTSMRGLNDYYIFLNELVRLDQDKYQAFRLENLEKFENDFVYRYIVERLGVKERREVHKLLKESFSQWNKYLYQFGTRKIAEKSSLRNYVKANHSILEKMYIGERAGFGNALWGVDWCVKQGYMAGEWMDCIKTLYSLELNKWSINLNANSKCKLRDAFGKSVVGVWANQLIPQVIISDEVTKKVDIRYCGSLKGCRANIDFPWMVDTLPTEDTLVEWLDRYKKKMLAIEIIAMFFEGFYGSGGRQEKIKISAQAGFGIGNKLEAQVKIENDESDFNILGFMTNLLDYETFYEDYHEALLQGWLDSLETEEKGRTEKLRKMKEEVRKKEGLSLYRQVKVWHKKTNGRVLPYQHTDIYVNLLDELRQWRTANLQGVFKAANVWALLRQIIVQIENILKEKEVFLKEADSGYNGWLLACYQECPVIKCIKDPGGMGLNKTFLEMFGRVFERCCRMNDYDNLYKPVNEIDTPEDVNTKEIQ